MAKVSKTKGNYDSYRSLITSIRAREAEIKSYEDKLKKVGTSDYRSKGYQNRLDVEQGRLDEFKKELAKFSSKDVEKYQKYYDTFGEDTSENVIKKKIDNAYKALGDRLQDVEKWQAKLKRPDTITAKEIAYYQDKLDKATKAYEEALADKTSRYSEIGFDPSKVKVLRMEGEAPSTTRTLGRAGEALIIDPVTFEVKGETSGKVYAKGADLQEALALETQIQSGGTPTISGRPDLFAIEPTAAEKEAGIRDIATSGGGTVTPSVATPEQLQQASGGTLPSFDAANLGTYLDGAAFQNLQTLGLTESDITRTADGRIYLKPGVTEETIRARQQAGTSLAPVTGAEIPITTSTSADVSGTGLSQTETEVVSGLETSVANKEAEVTASDPTLVVTAEMRAAWLAEAYDELRNNNAWNEKLRLVEFDLGTSFNRLIEDTRLREMSLYQTYKENLAGTQTSLQNRGLLYGGVRGEEERQLAEKTNFQLAQEDIAFKRGLQERSQQGERYFGSDYAIRSLAPTVGRTETVGRVIAGTPSFVAGDQTQAFSALGGIYGDFPRAAEEEARTRAGEREASFLGATSQYA